MDGSSVSRDGVAGRAAATPGKASFSDFYFRETRSIGRPRSLRTQYSMKL